jgi:cytosine/adenosine deaminase-related metal-dependent hydrolase
MNDLPTKQQDVWSLATEADKLAALASLGSLPSRATSSENLDKAGYFVALEGVTRYGLSTAIRAILQGALDHAFFPSPPELRKQCDKAMEPHREMRARIAMQERIRAEQPPPIPQRTPEQVARVAAAYERFRGCVEDTKAKEIEAERAEVRARYGMTEDVLASIADRPAPDRMGK